jgi:hypothetical protein
MLASDGRTDDDWNKIRLKEQLDPLSLVWTSWKKGTVSFAGTKQEESINNCLRLDDLPGQTSCLAGLSNDPV